MPMSSDIYSPFEDYYNTPVYSPAFSDPPSPASSETEDLPPVKGVTMLSNTPPQPRVTKKRTREAREPTRFINKKPRFPTIYHEALQPMAPATTLPVNASVPCVQFTTSEINAKLQDQLVNLLRLSDLSEIESFLKEHSENIDLNRCQNEWGESVLHEACVAGDLPLVKVLVRFGANHRLTNRDGFTLIHLASFSGNQDLLAYVLGLYQPSSQQ